MGEALWGRRSAASLVNADRDVSTRVLVLVPELVLKQLFAKPSCKGFPLVAAAMDASDKPQIIPHVRPLPAAHLVNLAQIPLPQRARALARS